MTLGSCGGEFRSSALERCGTVIERLRIETLASVTVNKGVYLLLPGPVTRG
jgi:hypothetical protein